jgi:hypothetical protein
VSRVVPSGHDVTERLDAAAAEALDAFEGADVDALLLKGRALAVLLYSAGERRRYLDVDLLVAPGRLEAAENALARLGYANLSIGHGIDDLGGVVHGQTWMRAADEIAIDLHAWLPGAQASPEIAWEALLARRAWIEVGGRRAAALDRAGQAMQLATHAAQHGPAFMKHTDELALALARWPAEVWVSAAALAHRIAATEAFAAGLRLVPEGRELASRIALPSTAELDWTIRHRCTRPRGTFHVRAVAEADNWRQRLEILRRSVFPNRTWIAQQHGWARDGGLTRLAAAYVLHLARAPLWAARAELFLWRARRAARRR